MIKLEITGFTNIAQAKAFANWYSGQGEQDIPLWLENRPECECSRLLTTWIDVVEDEQLVQLKVTPY